MRGLMVTCAGPARLRVLHSPDPSWAGSAFVFWGWGGGVRELYRGNGKGKSSELTRLEVTCDCHR